MSDNCWRLSAPNLAGLTPTRARDLVVECFYHAHHETLARAKQRLGAAHVDDDAIRANVIGAVRLAFRESGGDFDHPTVASLRGAIQVLARKADAWGTPADIVAHHRGQIETMLERLDGRR